MGIGFDFNRSLINNEEGVNERMDQSSKYHG